MQREPSRLELSKVEKLTSVSRPVEGKPESKARKPGLYFVAAEPNAFGIPSVHTCPGMTEECQQDCYAIGSEYRAPTAIKLQRNWDILRDAETVEGMEWKLSEMMGEYRLRADKLAVPAANRRMRIHWSGDFYCPEYALAWRMTMESSPEKFFTFTRSFQEDVNVLPLLTGIKNLDLFLSVDSQNVDRAAVAIKDAPDARVAYLVDYLDDADALIAKMGREELLHNLNFACPENMAKGKGGRSFPIINEKGGACSRCKYCFGKTKPMDVIFVKKGLKRRPTGFDLDKGFEFDTPVPVVFRARDKKIIDPEEFETNLDPDPSISQPIGQLILAGAQDSLF